MSCGQKAQRKLVGVRIDLNILICCKYVNKIKNNEQTDDLLYISENALFKHLPR